MGHSDGLCYGPKLWPDIAVIKLVGKRMVVLHQFLQPFLQDMGVDLCGRNIGMAEQLLHSTKVGAVLKQVTCEGVAQPMRRDLSRVYALTRR